MIPIPPVPQKYQVSDTIEKNCICGVELLYTCQNVVLNIPFGYFRCHKVLAPKGLDVINIITSTDKGTFDNILNSFVGIAAIQIGLTDILRELDLVPDHIIGKFYKSSL